MNPTELGEALFNGLSISSILILTALGLGITFGVMRVINMAHGEMLTLGAYVAFVVEEPAGLPTLQRNLAKLVTGLARTFKLPPEVASDLGRALAPDPGSQGFHLSIYWAIPLAFAFVGLVGYLLEVTLIRFLYGRPLDTLLATWGVSLVLQQLILLLFGADLKPVSTPEALSGHWQLGPVAVPIYRMFIVATTAFCLLAVYLLFYRTTVGLRVRAVTQNRPMAAALGISTRKVDAFTFAFASGLAGVAGCILAHLYTVKYTMGGDYVIQAFMVVILGGMGQLAGTVGGGVLIGTSNSFIEKILGSAPMAKFLVLVVVIAVIQLRPAGLFAAKERSYD